jgi:ketosteroid isomerase-like protein
MTNTEQATSRLIDEADIRTTLARFGMAATLGDVTALRDLWTEDAVWTIGAPADHTAEGVDDIAAMYEGLRAGNDYFVQLTIPGAITIDGDTANVRSLCQEFASGPNERYYRTNGIWNDQLRRTDTGWKFTDRTWQYLWVDYSPYSGQTFPVES